MQARCLTAVCSTYLLIGFATSAQAVCGPGDQIAPNPNPDGATLTITSGTACNGADPYENLGTLNNDGTLVNEGVLANGVQPFSDSTLNNFDTLTNSVGATLQNYGTLENFGTLVNEGSMGGGQTGFVGNYGTLVNKGSASAFTLTNDGTLSNEGEANVSFLRNSGTVVNDAFLGTETTFNSGTLVNNDAFELRSSRNLVNSGLVVNNGTLAGGVVNTGTLHNNGALTTDGVTWISNEGVLVNAGQMGGPVTNTGQLSILAGGTVGSSVPTLDRYSQTAGSTTVNGALSMYSVDINGGVLALGGGGSITTFGGGVNIDGGTMTVGNSPGATSIFGDYTQTMAGSFEAEIGGLLQGVEYDYLSVSGTATLDGLLDVSLYDLGGGVFSPTLGDTFDILSAESIVGGFSNFAFAALDAGLLWEVSYLTDFYGTTDVVRLHVAAVPEPEIYAMMLTGLGIMGWAARRKQRRRVAV